MKISVFIAAAVAAGAMTIASHADDASSREKLATANAEATPSTLGDALKRALRAGEADGTEVASLGPGAASADLDKMGVDKMVTGATKAPGKKGGTERPYHSIISRYASENGVPVVLAHAVISVESNYRPSARGSAGEIGLMQIKPATARMMGYSGSAKGLYEPETNIKYGMKYLGKAFKLGGGNTCSAILKYNAGHAAKRMNPISSAYCKKVKRLIGGK
ncbi:transglycosylase SLT domain-containing protein [Chelativorans sp. AA-79]|uniref:lytic transglycosylase domain-containing protein n=1 Tax=Chelativorans sp. AA-79 TaxID=3028735 RepID=UPI0023F8C946|nr:transglycosylase SLT domain-containing protein [Chelativorans sp. AA-79]WEX11341.1 transglycosylase SLT domain-containing protein [Chelativorans sp. AA-79]